MATSFTVHQSLREVRLDGNRIGDKGAGKLADALKCNCVIEELDLGRNHISGHAQVKIQTILADPSRKAVPNEKKSALKQLEILLAKSNEEIAAKDEEITTNGEEIARKDEALARKDKQIASLKADIGCKNCIIGIQS